MGNMPSAPSKSKTRKLLKDVDKYCRQAATAITQADVLIVTTGAGFSADSGLAIYRDVAKVPAYSERKVEYHDLCVPDWLEDEPEFFWGFWGGCFNDYRDTDPHEGYGIIRKWSDDMFRNSTFAEKVRARLQDSSGFLSRQGEDEPYRVESFPGAFYLFTSNVDAHSYDHFEASEIRECHGNVECFQCSRPCCGKIWRAPEDLRFALDKETMTATIATPEQKAAMAAENEAKAVAKARETEEEGKAVAVVAKAEGEGGEGGEGGGDVVPPAASSAPGAAVGRINGSARQYPLRYMPPPRMDGPMSPEDEAAIFPEGAIPLCPSCGERARPSILMFDDGEYLWHKSQDVRWRTYKKCVEAEIAELAELAEGQARKARVAILEVGAGNNVTTVRNTSEQLCCHFSDACVSLIRVNPELPLADDPELQKEGHEFIPIMAYGLEAIKKINATIVQWQAEAEAAQLEENDAARCGDLSGFLKAVGALDEGAVEGA